MLRGKQFDFVGGRGATRGGGGATRFFKKFLQPPKQREKYHALPALTKKLYMPWAA